MPSSRWTPEGDDPVDLRVEDLARQPIARDRVSHHPSGLLGYVLHRHLVTCQRQLVGRRETGRPGADDEHVPAGRRRVDAHRPAMSDRLVAEEPLDRVDADGVVEVAAVAGRLARVVADPAHHGRKGVDLHDRAPGGLVAGTAGLREVEPVADRLAGRARVAAGCGAVDVDRPLGAPGAGQVRSARAGAEGGGEGELRGHRAASSRSPKCAMERSAWRCNRATTSGMPSPRKRWANRVCVRR